LNNEQGGGTEERRHMLHHLSSQRPYSNPTLVPRFGNELQLLHSGATKKRMDNAEMPFSDLKHQRQKMDKK